MLFFFVCELFTFKNLLMGWKRQNIVYDRVMKKKTLAILRWIILKNLEL